MKFVITVAGATGLYFANATFIPETMTIIVNPILGDCMQSGVLNPLQT